LTEERLKFAVFIDFDNIEIGVRTTLSRRFDIDAVLEAIKERGEVVTKVAYGNWKRSDEYSQAMTEHAVQMVQRNVTPRGDKNGADINLALDALEMAFTRDHINAFVIVGGDSDFIALVEKLKQYDKTVYIVGGRAFTSIILQKNCHEFIAYENLIGAPAPRRSPAKTASGSRAPLEDALPLIRRALKILADREVSPQLGLLKSTLLQLDSTFSERDYGTGTFREFMEKLANAGHLNLKQVDRSLIVEMSEGEVPAPAQEAAVPEPPAPPAAEPVPFPPRGNGRDLARVFQGARIKPRWPMYLRSMKQYLRAVEPGFDERSYGYTTVHDLVRQGQREGLFRVERNRHGILRIFPGDRFPDPGAYRRPAESPAGEYESMPADFEQPSSDYEPAPTEYEAEAIELEPAHADEAPIPVETAPDLAPRLMEAAAGSAASTEQGPGLTAFAGAGDPQVLDEEKPKRKRRASSAASPKRKTEAAKRPRTRRRTASGS
jgi:uncharacterized protein (TIGR00288 family)